MIGLVRIPLLAFARSSATPRSLRWALLTVCGLHAGTRAIAAHTTFTGPRVIIGRGCSVNRDCLFDASAPITIGDDVAIGMGCLFVTSTHHIGPEAQRAGDLEARPIVVGHGSWIGARSVILPGVTIGAGCVIAAGSVVTRDCEASHMYAGVPARQVKALS